MKEPKVIVQYKNFSFERKVVNTPMCTGCTLYEDKNFTHKMCDEINDHLENSFQQNLTCYYGHDSYAIFVVQDEH